MIFQINSFDIISLYIFFIPFSKIKGIERTCVVTFYLLVLILLLQTLLHNSS